MDEYRTENEIRNQLVRMSAYPSNLTKLAAELGFTAPYLGDVVHFRRNVSPRLAEALGYKMERVYFKLDKPA